MRCISLWQPWATLLVLGAKQFETRGKDTRYRGPLLIHAAKKFNHDLHRIATKDPFWDILKAAGIKFYGLPGGRNSCRDTMPRGAIIGMVNVKGSISTNHLQDTNAEVNEFHTHNDLPEHLYNFLKVTAQEHAFGDYRPGRFAWKCTDHTMFEEPIPMKGQQGPWDVPELLIPEKYRTTKGGTTHGKTI